MNLISIHKNINFLFVSVMFIPFSLVLGTFVLNSNIFLICLLVIVNCIFDRNKDKYFKESWLRASGSYLEFGHGHGAPAQNP